ncbi:MAG: sulfate ABC transporter permease subunit CysT [Planctomycetes bacterium]|nr:sulfate ABC transporter permease subunit CysT [Planctomycetota bacterium]
MAQANARVLPGYRLSISFTLFYLSVLVIIPLGACVVTATQLSWEQFRAAVWTERARAAYALTFGAALVAATISGVVGLLIAWVLVRYEFPGKRIVDSLVDLPFALPTAVAGLVFSNLYVANGWLGRFLVPLGIEGAYSRFAIVLVLTFIGFPFVVRTLQPVLEALDTEAEEAAALLGASRWQTFRRITLPALLPGLLTGFALAFARGLGEYGSVVFVSGNMPFKTEIAAFLIVSRLEEGRPNSYREATAIATVLLCASFLMLVVINRLEALSRRA